MSRRYRNRYRDRTPPRRRPSILSQVVALQRNGPWYLPLAGGLVVCFFFALVLPLFLSAVLAGLDGSTIAPLIEKRVGHITRAAYLLSLTALIATSLLSAWKYVVGRRMSAAGARQTASVSRVVSRFLD